MRVPVVTSLKEIVEGVPLIGAFSCVEPETEARFVREIEAQGYHVKTFQNDVSYILSKWPGSYDFGTLFTAIPR